MRWKGLGPYGGRFLEGNESANCRQNHSDYARSCKTYKKEKEIIEVKHKRSMSFQKSRKIVGTYMGENSYASVARREDTVNQDNRYRALVEKLIQQEPNDWPKLHEQLKNLHSAELQTQPWPVSSNKEITNEPPTNQQTNPTAQTQTTPKKENHRLNLTHRSSIRPPSSKLDNPNLELNCEKLERFSQSKMDYATSSTVREPLKVSTLPNQKADIKNRFKLLERM